MKKVSGIENSLWGNLGHDKIELLSQNMFWTIKLSFVVDNSTFFGWATHWAIFLKFWDYFFKSSGRPVARSLQFPLVGCV